MSVSVFVTSLSNTLFLLHRLSPLPLRHLHRLRLRASATRAATFAKVETTSDFGVSSVPAESEEEELDHHLLTAPNGDVAFLKEKPVWLAKELL
ncbi:hypothetical protein LOK49_LG02G01113 [Camellia lanceoleosa]|uniref:Uncharacterized protein n=1 Tax=Camellia lanceoleosa TaxID=1840588 RepID=A0ACC0IND6_9ERIC|nr:hypothetical protein LOK49_LG02G01113 [Camellia lanceoleosa]